MPTGSHILQLLFNFEVGARKFSSPKCCPYYPAPDVARMIFPRENREGKMKPFFINWLTHNRTGQRMWFLDSDFSEDGEKWLGFKQFLTIHIYKMRPKEKYKGMSHYRLP